MTHNPTTKSLVHADCTILILFHNRKLGTPIVGHPFLTSSHTSESSLASDQPFHHLQLSSILALYSPEFDAVHAATAAGMAARLCDGALQHHSTVTALNTILPLLHTHAPSLDLQGLGQSLSSLAELGLPRTHPTCILLLLQLRHRLCGDADSETKEVVSAAAAGSSAVGGKLAAVGRVWQSNGRGGGLWVDEVSGGRRNSRNSPGSSNPQAPVKLQAVAAVACALAVLDVSDVHLQLPLVRMAVAVVQADAHSAADREEEENDDLDDGDDREPSRRQRGKGMTGGAEYASPSTRVKHYRDLIWAFATLSASSGHHETSLGVTDQGSSTISEQQQQQEAAAMIGQVRSLTQRLCMTIAEEVEGVLESRGALRLPTLEVLMWGFATLGHNDSHLSTAAVVSGGSSWDSASKTTTGSAAGGGGRLSVRLAPVWEALCDAVHAHGDRVLVTQEQAANMLHSLALAARSMASVSEEALSSSGEAQRRRRRQREMLLPFRDLQPLLLRGLLHSGDGGGAGSRRGEVEGSTVGQPAELLAATAWAIAELAQAGAPCRRFSLDTASSPEQDVDESEDDEREEAVIGSVSWTAGALGPASVVQLLLAEACEDLEARGAVPVLVSCETGENTAVDGATGLGVGRVADAVGTSGESKGDVGSGIGEGLFVQMYEAQLWLWDTVGEEQTALAPDSVLQSCRTAYARTSA